MTSNIFFCIVLQAQGFLCVIIICIISILLLQRILNISDCTDLVGELSTGRGADSLGRCLRFRELSEQQLI